MKSFLTENRPRSSFETSYSTDFSTSYAPQPAASPFLLHTPTEPPSRLDPSLEISRDLSNWGMTMKSSSRTPRKTWMADHTANSPSANLTS